MSNNTIQEIINWHQASDYPDNNRAVLVLRDDKVVVIAYYYADGEFLSIESHRWVGNVVLWAEIPTGESIAAAKGVQP